MPGSLRSTSRASLLLAVVLAGRPGAIPDGAGAGRRAGCYPGDIASGKESAMAAPHSAASSLPPLTPADVRDLADSASFSKGQAYHRQGMISRTVRRGDTLVGMSYGSSGGPYQVRATLTATG